MAEPVTTAIFYDLDGLLRGGIAPAAMAAQRLLVGIFQQLFPEVRPSPCTVERLNLPAVAQSPGFRVSHLHNLRLTARLARTTELTPRSVEAKCREILEWYAAAPLCRTELMRTGRALATFKEAVQWAVTGFQSTWLGFMTLLELLQYLCADSELYVARALGHPVILMRSAVRAEDELLPDLPPRGLQSLDTYRTVLETRYAIFRHPTIDGLYAVTAWLVEHAAAGGSFADLTDRAVSEIQPAVAVEQVRAGLATMVRCGVFQREPAGLLLAQQYLTPHAGFTTASAVIDFLRADVRQHLLTTRAEVSDELLLELLCERYDTTYRC